MLHGTMIEGSLLLANYVRVLEWATIVCAVIILISSLDDTFIDLYYWLRQAYRFVYLKSRGHQPLPIAKLVEKPEQPIAIMVPAWQESSVIGQMIENTVATLEYSNFKIFCGSYPNDPATGEIVDRMARRYKQVVHVRVPHPGPTCKADCLNWIIQAIFLTEEKQGITFAGIVLHDSEDVIHPLELKLYNFLLPRKDLIQLPVLSLERSLGQFVAGTYLDDFAEWHSKDLVVRESFLGEVPSAGVGTCFSHRAIRALSDETNNQPFNTESLTEDYDFSYRLAKLGMKQVFVRFPVSYTVRRKAPLTGREREIEQESVIAVREFFPDSFRAAYRQRARWILGIVFQGWLEMAWRGNWRTRYILMRDRKGVVTSVVTMVAYFLLFNYLLAMGVHQWTGDILFVSLIDSRDWVQTVLALNFVMLCNRVGQRFYFVSLVYGVRQGLMSLPRMIVNNVINFFATMRAWKLFVSHVILGQRIAWDKTDHVYPSINQLRESRRRLGDLLLAWKAIDAHQIEEAMARQTTSGEFLGSILVQEGWLPEDTLADALAYQNGLDRAEFDADALLRHQDLLPSSMIIRYQALPIGVRDGRTLLLAAAGPLGAEPLAAIEKHWGGSVVVMIATPTEVKRGLRLLVGGTAQESADSRPLLGEILLRMGALRRQDIEQALIGYAQDLHGRFGDHLVGRTASERCPGETVQPYKPAVC